KNELHGLETYVAQIIRSSTFPTFLGEIDHLLTLKPEPATHYLPVNPALTGNAPVDSARIERWIENKECENNPDPTEREAEIIRDNEDGVTPSARVNQLPRY